MAKRQITFEDFCEEMDKHLSEGTSYALALRKMDLSYYSGAIKFNERQSEFLHRMKKHYRKQLDTTPLDQSLKKFTEKYIPDEEMH